MKKVLILFIPLCMLLFFSSSSLFAHEVALPSSNKIELLDGSKIEGVPEAIQHFSKNTLNESFEQNLIFNEKEKEEDDVIATVPQKSLVKSSCFISYFNQKKIRDYFYHFANSSCYHEEFFCLSSYSPLYIIFKVFRI